MKQHIRSFGSASGVVNERDFPTRISSVCGQLNKRRGFLLRIACIRNTRPVPAQLPSELAEEVIDRTRSPIVYTEYPWLPCQPTTPTASDILASSSPSARTENPPSVSSPTSAGSMISSYSTKTTQTTPFVISFRQRRRRCRPAPPRHSIHSGRPYQRGARSSPRPSPCP
jgi:hypothetical protein